MANSYFRSALGGFLRPAQVSTLAGLLGIALVLGTLSYRAVEWFGGRGYTLYFGDAEAHLNIARRVFDSRTSNGEQLGTVWLPAPHVLMLPFVGNDAWWKSGLAGAIPAAVCFVLAGLLLFDLTRRALGSALAGWVAALLFALNPNLLYLQSAPMTEAFFFAGLMGLLHATLWHAGASSNRSAWVAVLSAAAWATLASMSRYEGWVLLPVAAVYLWLGSRGSFWRALVFGVLAAAGPVAWLAHNWWYWGDALEFYRGPWSAMAIYQRQLAGGMSPYPGDHDWWNALTIFRTAAELVIGMPLALLAQAGFVLAAWQNAEWKKGRWNRLRCVAVFLGMGPVFYLWSIHSSGTPIFVPSLWPNSYYNTRYALAALPLAAFGGATLVAASPRRARPWVALAVLGLALVPWFRDTREEAWLVWKESQVNSVQRRAWTKEAAEFLKANYREGDGILMPFGDVTGVLREAGIPLRESLHEGNHPGWEAAIARPELFLHEAWAISFSGEAIATALLRAERRGLHYTVVKRITIPGAPVVEIYRRERTPKLIVSEQETAN